MLETGGLWAVDTQAPSYRQLRPFNQPDGYSRLPETEEGDARNWETEGFPVHKGLSTHLLNVVEHPDPVVAHVMAVCSGYAYSGPETVSMIMARMGLEENHCRLISATVDAMFICSRAFLVQSADGKVVILCYRGTEPTNLANGLTDLDVEPQRISYQFEDPCASVHAGFYRNVRVTRYEIMEALRRAVSGRSVRKSVDGESERMPGKLEALYITGHSLGGAMASMMAVMLRQEKKYATIADLLKGVYTFGQPMIGDPSFARACESDGELSRKVIRYIHGDDVIPHFPPVTAGPYMHFGREYRYRISHLRESVSGWLRYMGSPHQEQTGVWQETDKYTSQMSSFLGFALGASTLAARKSQILRALPVVYSLEDHLPAHYIGTLTPRRVSDEFGD
ncbi:lipase family protein [Streptomyces shenzhenensis]|uniref:lipase family protein n=1 Tax=Streptomyces shenzhenensis TaxID=943815 RepID=UPI003D8DB779